jgi:hypothetical protein
MVKTMVRLEVGHSLKLGYQYTEAQKGHLFNLIKYLCKDARENEKEITSDVLTMYQFFYWLLIYSTGEATQKSWGNPIQHFI